MTKPLSFHFFMMATPSHHFHGGWRHPESRSIAYNKLETWIELAKLAERGKVDTIFIADVFGMYEGQGGNSDLIVKNAIHFPVGDPAVILSAMAAVTSNLGFIYTNSILQQHPFTFARQMSTLDHLTEGRVGWNIVTTASKNGSRSMGLDTLTDHDERYRWADEYTEVVYKLWEGSWEDDAVLRDTVNGIYADPAKVHRINHVGKRYSVEGPHLIEPSPQRTPVLFQAGTSSAGQAFAARNAEGVFIMSGSPQRTAEYITQIKSVATAAGRHENDIQFLEGLSFIVGSTEEEARRKEAEIDGWMNFEAEAAMRSAATGLDLTKYDPDTPLVELLDKAHGMRSVLQLAIDAAPPGETATVKHMLLETQRLLRVVGTPESIADRLEEYQRAGINGVNLIYSLLPGSFADFVDHVAPVLQKRGLMKEDYLPGTLREKLSPGRGPRLNDRHPATQYRHGAALSPAKELDPAT